MIAKTHTAIVHGVDTSLLIPRKFNYWRSFRDIIPFPIWYGEAEKAEVVANCDHLQALKFSRTNPYAFTEHGAVMLAAVLNSEAAIATSIAVVMAFVDARKWAMEHAALAQRMDELEKKYDSKFSTVFAAIRKIIEQPVPARKMIGYKQRDQ